MSPADVFAAVKGFFAKSDAVTVNSGRGSQGIEYGSKMFVMFEGVEHQRYHAVVAHHAH